MARHARIWTSIWDDPDFAGLTCAEQHMYFLLLSNAGLSRCGVIDYIPSRFEHLARDLTIGKFTKGVRSLRLSRFVVVDERTQELLVRTYVRHDGVLDRVNMGKATGNAFEAVVSGAIREAIGEELHALMKDDPDKPGWLGLAEASPTAHAMACGMESRMQ